MSGSLVSRSKRWAARSGRRAAWVLGSLTVLSVALHCGTASESTFNDVSGGPCASLYRGLCGVPCAADAECADGLYCGIDNKCNADCAPGHACLSGFLCSTRGRCGGELPGTGFPDGGSDDGSAVTDAVCADTDVALTKTLPKVLFLLDQSSSMHSYRFPNGLSNGCNPDCRWTVLKDVLIGPAANPGGLLQQLEGEAEIAVEMYSATDSDPNDGDNSFLVGPTDNVCPRFNGKAFSGLSFSVNAYASTEAELRPATVDDDTPTGPAIRTVVGLGADGGVGDQQGFAALASTAPKVLVLVTDGEPAVCGENYPSDPGRAAVIQAVQQTHTHGIKTFVIAIGDTTVQAQQHFNAVANAGQGLDPQTGDAGAILPSTPQQLLDALKKVVLDARTCVFDLNGKVEPGMEKLGTVTLNGDVVPLDAPGAPEEGWRLVNPSQIELVGAACATLKSTPDAKLSARFPCGAVSPTVPK
ncbi:MAG: VWA domain-containing protein [Labilithrix sp.]|nr:VWA domain-containing protein [Labilithrix sp.]